MQSETVSVKGLFQDRRQYHVPFFQRAYVWNREDQWERLWNDISENADTRVTGEGPAPHFLGAAVLEPQQRKGLMGVDTLHIIDGQQRLSTLQYFLAALSIVLREAEAASLLSIVKRCLWNDNEETMRQPEIEIFKVWPTFRDRPNYHLAMTALSASELLEKFPYSFTKDGTLRKIDVDHPRPLEAIWYFAGQIRSWVTQEGDCQKEPRLTAISEAVLQDLQLVSISLGEQDDAQVIFETLNGHGAQLHATDLIRNFIFMRADREGVAGADLFDGLWSQFEDPFWGEAQRRGRLQRPRLEWFIQAAVEAALGDDVEIGRVYRSYQRFAVREATRSAEQQLRFLDKQADNYRQLISGTGADPIASFGRRVAVWDASTTHPLALRIADSDLTHEAQKSMYDMLVSYLVRRAICGLVTKNYNKIFIGLLKKLSPKGLTQESLRVSLSELEGAASYWPRNDEFRRAWLNDPLYPGRLDASRCKFVLSELEAGLRSLRSEEPVPVGLENLDIDHVLPTSWFEHWPFADGTTATLSDSADAARLALIDEKLSGKQAAILKREKAKLTIGNLTLLHYGLNRSLQNSGFPVKREKLFAESNLQLNRSLMRLEDWNEAEILARGESLFKVAVQLWEEPS
jgi:hypothetical protein